MADVFPLPMNRTGRKRWTLYNSRGVQRLGSQLAEDGCPDSQVVLAKQLLDETCDVDDDQEENARLGVYWLIKASEQGHEEATNILRHCLETGQGISEHNYLDVKACLDMSQEEKIAQRAARELFATISDGEDFITTCQLQERMVHLSTHGGDKEEPPGKEELPTVDWKSRSDGEKLTEDMLISAASTYCRGELPVVQAILSLDAPSHSHFLQEALLHPLHVIQRSYNRLIDTISRHNLRSFLPFINIANLQVAVLVIFYMSVGFDGLLAALPTAVYYLSIAIMFISTCRILSKKRDFHNFRRWSNLFIAYSNGSVNAAEAEFQHCRNNLRPYGSFFLALFVHLLLYPLVPMAVLQSELAVIAFFFTFITLYNFTLKDVYRSGAPDFLALFSFGVHVLAKYPYETDAVVSQGWRFLDVHFPTFASYVVGNGVEFCLNFRALFYLVIPAVLLKMAARDNWKGSYMTLIPHCVSLAWWQVAVIASQGATWFSLIRSALALVGMVLFLPLAGLATVLLPVAAAAKFLAGSDELVRITTTSVLAFFPVLLAYYLGRIKALGTKFARFLGWIQLLLAILAGLLLLWPALHYDDSAYSIKSAPSLVTWNQYREYCSCSERQLQVQCDMQCTKLAGLPITWEGRVIAARIVRVYNPIIQITNRLPLRMKTIISCVVGEEYDSFEKSKTVEDTRTSSEFINKCHLANWDRYSMEIDITVLQGSGLWRSGETEAVLVADNSFKNFTKALTAGDRIWFSGVLIGNANGVLDSVIPRVELFEIACLSCQDTTLSAVKRTQLISLLTLKDLYTGIKTVLNFLFNPLIIFR